MSVDLLGGIVGGKREGVEGVINAGSIESGVGF